MNWTSAQDALDKKQLVYRESWPTGTVLVKQGGYKVNVSDWRSGKINKETLIGLGLTDELEIKPHLDLVSSQFKYFEIGYQITTDDIQAVDWQIYTPQQQVGTPTDESQNVEETLKTGND